MELKKANSVIATNGYAVNTPSNTEALLEEYDKLSYSLNQYQMTFDEFESIVYPSINENASLMRTDDYELGDVTSAFDMLTDYPLQLH